VRRPPACPLEPSKEPSPAADSAHRVPFLAGFLGGEHCAIDFAKVHFPPFSSIIKEKAAPSAAGLAERPRDDRGFAAHGSFCEPTALRASWSAVLCMNFLNALRTSCTSSSGIDSDLDIVFAPDPPAWRRS
jgi:hypothetical protein